MSARPQRKYPSRCQVYRWRDTDYLGREAVAEASGRTLKTVDFHLQKHGDLSRLGMGNRRPNSKGTAIPITLYGRDWPSRSALARDLGVPRTTLNHWLRRNPDRILALLMRQDAKHTQEAMAQRRMIDGSNAGGTHAKAAA